MSKKVNGKKFSSEYQPQEKWTEEKAIELGESLLEWMRVENNLFFEEFLLIENDYYDSLITYLREKFPSFSQRIDKAKRMQEIKLFGGGVKGDLNAQMTKFTLNVNHGFIETNKTDNKTETTLKVEQPIFDLKINDK